MVDLIIRRKMTILRSDSDSDERRGTDSIRMERAIPFGYNLYCQKWEFGTSRGFEK